MAGKRTASKAATTWVRATGDYTDGGKVVLWERDDRHPNGEIFIGDDSPVEVFETDAVALKLRSGELERIDAPEGVA